MSEQAEETWPSTRRGWVVTLILLLAFTFSFVDRQVLNLLVDYLLLPVMMVVKKLLGLNLVVIIV